MSYTSFQLRSGRHPSALNSPRRGSQRTAALWFAAGAAGLSLCATYPTHAAAKNEVATYTSTTGGTWSNGANWSTNPDFPSGTNAGAILTSIQTANRSITVDTPVTLQSLAVENNLTFTNSIATATGGSLTFDGGGNGVSVSVSGTGGGNLTISMASAFNDNVTAVVNHTTATSGAGSLNWTGAVTGGTGGFTKQGPGILTFGTGGKLYTGPTVFDTNSGRTRLSVAGSPTATSSVTVKAGSQLTLISANGKYTWGTGNLNLNGTGPGVDSPQNIFPGVIRNDTNLVAEITNPVVLQSDSLIHVQGAATGSTTLSGGVSGPGGLTVTALNSNNDIGRLVLTGPGSYQGPTTVNGGTLRLGAASAAAAGGTSGIVIDTNDAGARGVLQIDTPNQINNTAPLTLDASTFNTMGNSEGGFDAVTGKGVPGLGALSMPASSILDLGNGASILAFANSGASTWTGSLSVYNWTGNPDTGAGTDRLFFGSDQTGLTPAQLAQITFFSDAGTTPIGTSTYQLSTGEVIPVVNGVPEPTSLAAIALGAMGLLSRRRKH